MRKISLLAGMMACCFLAWPGRAQEIKFTDTEHDFGNVQYLDSAVYRFQFVNTGDAPLLISRVASSCGCTVPTYQKAPVAPGAKGEVIVKYVYTDRLVAFNKQVTVYSNAKKNSAVNLYIRGVVVADKKKADEEDAKNKDAKKE